MNIRYSAIAGAAILALVVGTKLASAASIDNHELANRLVLQFVAAQNVQDVSLFDDVFPENYIQHNPDVPPGLSGVKKAFGAEFDQIKAHHVPFKVTIEDVAVDGDRVILRSLTKFRQKGKWLQARSIDEWRIVDGKLGEHWDSDSEPRPLQK